MPDLDPIKVKVVVEYDPEGLDQAKEDLAKLSEIGGGSGEAVGGLTEDLAGLEAQASKTAESTRSFSSAIEELPKIVESGTSGVTEMNSVLSDQQDVLSAIDDPLKSYNENLQTLSDTMSKGHLSENMSVFQDALANPEPYQMVTQYLTETGQTWGDFASSIGESNVAILKSNDAFRSDVMQMGDMFPIYSSKAEDYANFVGTVGTTAQDAAGQLGGFNAVATETGKQLDQAGASALSWARGINEFGGAGALLYGPEEFSFGFGDVLSSTFAGMSDVLGGMMMPAMMAMQMIVPMVSQFGQGIYDMATVAEGPAAHSVGTFTGTVDALGQTIQSVGGTFSESFGRQFIPTLNAMNYELSQSNDLSSNLGGSLGATSSFLTNWSNISTGALLFMNPFTAQAGGNMIAAGTEGFINQGAQLIGMQQPFQGPGPSTQSTYDVVNVVHQQTIQTQDQVQTLLEDATNPQFLAQQNQLMAAQQVYQRMQQSYDISHPINQQQMLQEFQYQQYADQQNALYNQQMQQSGGYDFTGFWGNVLGPVGADSQAILGSVFGPIFGPAMQGISNLWGATQPQQQSTTDLTGPPSTPFDGFFGGVGQTWHDMMSAGAANLGSLGHFFSDIGGGIGGIFSSLFGPQAPTISSTGGCFPAGTCVLMADGSERAIERLAIGERVVAHDGTKQVTTTILALIKPPPKRVYELVFSDGKTLTLTDSHPIATTQGWKSIEPKATEQENPGLVTSRLMWGDIIYTAHGTCQIASITPLQGRVQVYNITVDEPHTFYANDILVHNKVANAEIGSQVSEQIGGIQLPHIDLSGISSQLAGSFGGIQLPHLDLSGLTSNLAGSFGGIQLPHIDLSGIASSLSGSFSGIQLPHIDLSSISSSLAGAFGGISLPSIPNIGGEINGALSGMFGGISLPSIPDVGGMINGAMSGMFGAISLPSIPNIGGEINGALSGMFSGISLPSVPEIGGMISGAMSGMFGGISLPTIPDLGSMLSGAMSGMFGGISLPPVPNLGSQISSAMSGMFSGISLPSIPFFAQGVEGFGGGLAVVGDAGPELVSLPSGSSVYPLSVGGGVGGSMAPISLGGGGGGGSMPQSVNLYLQIGDAVISQMGIPLAQNMRLVAGFRGY